MSTDDRAEFVASRDAGLVKRHEQRLARARDGIEFPADGVERTAYLEGEPVTDMVIPPDRERLVRAAAYALYLDRWHGDPTEGQFTRERYDDAEQQAIVAVDAVLALLPVQVTSREPEGDALKAIEKWYADMHGEDSPMFNFSSGRMSAPDDESDLKSLVETATRLGRELGRREAAEEIAEEAMKQVRGQHERTAAWDRGYAAGVTRGAELAREIATKEPK